MSAPIIGVRQATAGAAALASTERITAALQGYRVLGWFGLALAAIAAADVALVFIPPLWGSAEWAFTSSAQVVSSLPILAVALGAMTASVIGRGDRLLAKLVGVMNLLLVVAILGIMLLFVPAAREALDIGAEVAQPGIRKMIIRVGLYALVFGALHVALALRCLRSSPGGAEQK